MMSWNGGDHYHQEDEEQRRFKLVDPAQMGCLVWNKLPKNAQHIIAKSIWHWTCVEAIGGTSELKYKQHRYKSHENLYECSM